MQNDFCNRIGGIADTATDRQNVDGAFWVTLHGPSSGRKRELIATGRDGGTRRDASGRIMVPLLRPAEPGVSHQRSRNPDRTHAGHRLNPLKLNM